MGNGRHRAGRTSGPGDPEQPVVEPAADPADPPRRRGRRTVKVVLGLVVGMALGLAALLGVGRLLGANPLPGERPAAGATGMEIYAKNCAACHGANGEGGSLSIKGPAFTAGGALAPLTFEERVAKIARGKPLNGMPGWKFRITDEEIRKVAAYTQLLSGQTPEPTVEGVR